MKAKGEENYYNIPGYKALGPGSTFKILESMHMSESDNLMNSAYCLLSVRARHPPLLKAFRIQDCLALILIESLHLSSAEECVQRTGIGAPSENSKGVGKRSALPKAYA